jgi:hypothetical protein
VIPKVLSHENYLIYAMKCYDNPNCSGLDEFSEDLARIKYIKKLITRYIQTGELQERLILNHLIILNNMFGPEALSRILCLKMETQLKFIKPFLVFLNILPPIIFNVGKEGNKVFTDDIPMDQLIIEKLRKI